MVPELVADTRCQIAEGPLWHPDEQCLYWTDIPAGRMYRLDPTSGISEQVYQGEPVGGIAVRVDGSLLLLGMHGSVRGWRDGAITETIHAEIPEERGGRFNDLIVDPEGRVISGTMAMRDEDGRIVRPGNLYVLESGHQPRRLMNGMGSPNGMGFTPDLRHLYLTDSLIGTQAIFLLDYDRHTGTLRNRRIFHRTPLDGSDGRPDGMIVDSEGCVWSARWDGGAVVRLRPDGTEAARFIIPVGRVSSVTFGGANLTDLYVTTASDGRNPASRLGAGGVFRLRGAGKGRPVFRSRVGPQAPKGL
jgi:D-xylonolactonase